MLVDVPLITEEISYSAGFQHNWLQRAHTFEDCKLLCGNNPKK